MKEITFHHDASLIPDYELQESAYQLLSEIERMEEATTKGYNDDRASLNLPGDTQSLEQVKTVIAEKKKLNPRYLIVVGIGGSNLGTIAVQEAIHGKLYNQLQPPLKVLFADTVDPDWMQTIINIVEPVLKRGENIIINGISKSGGTTETIANFEVLINLLKQYKKEYEQYVVVTTDRESRFWKLAGEKGFAVLEIPKKVGGRYSVFSPVGLFPLGMLDIDIEALLNGAALMRDKCLSKSITENPAALSALSIYLHKLEGKRIHDVFLFATDLESLGKWYRQLMGESIGKEFTRGQKQVFEGITPTVSIGSTDLHSMAQLYLGGPYDKFTTFVSVVQNNAVVAVPDFHEYNQLVERLQGQPIDAVMQAILKGVQAAFRQGNRPFVEILLPDKSAASLGQFMQMKMMEMMYLGFLLDVNPFDQPNVEAYKRETRKILEGHTI